MKAVARTIRTLLVANRGEIAVRIMRTARGLGIRTVAVYSDADRDAPHVAAADLAVAIGPAPAHASYLQAGKIVDAARAVGADAVHPGYGFLAEHAGFAEACDDAGLVFVGPPAAAMRAMGDKIAAKARMVAAGVPTAPAHISRGSSLAELTVAAERIGFPLLVKAAAGGGGRGMRIVCSPEALADAVASASAEARSAFGDGEVFLEKLVEGARHVEVQVFCDQHGGGIHLGERECSVQRRHQKIIEEAPSPAVDAGLRARIGAAAVTVARSIGYVGAGTVEFLLDDERNFYFLEMNTRLQVEHPVTELVTGIDLVQWQLRIAEGERLALTQEQVQLAGHAIEARICAEDPYAGFLPKSGKILRWRAAAGPRVRVDTGVQTGQTVSPHYDSMLAKVIAYGPRRSDAIRALDRALADCVLLGVTTNRAYLRALLASEAFVTASIRTDTIDRAGVPAVAPAPSDLLWAIAACARVRGDDRRVVGATDPSRWGNAGSVYPTPVALVWGDRVRHHDVTVLGEDRFRVSAEGVELELAFVDVDANGRLAVQHADVRRWFDVVTAGDVVAIDDDGQTFHMIEPHLTADVAAEPGSDGRVRVPIGGRVLAVAVAVGEHVDAGRLLASIEAMKIEHRVVAPLAGIIREIAIHEGGQADAGMVAFLLDPDPIRNEGASDG